MVNELEVEIDGMKVTVPQGSTVMDAARKLGLFIPHFCYHPHLSIAANCRMCLVDVEKSPKPLPACATPVTQGLKVWTHSQRAVDAQQSVMRFILINHPLDCPICDQGGECALQDVAMGYGATESPFAEEKRVVDNKDFGPLISTDMTRCIYCTRCVRFGTEVAGVAELGVAGRGEHSEIMTFMSSAVTSEVSGNVIDLCPVGALTSKPFYYSARSWELSRRLSVSAHDSLGSNLIVQTKLGRVYRVLPFENPDINECWLSDRDRFSYEALKHEHRLSVPMLRKDGQLNPISWEEAFTVLCQRFSACQGGKQRLGTIAHPMATLEELFLLSVLHEYLGADRPHAYPGHRDPRIGETRRMNWLGMPLSELADLDHVFVIGSFLRDEHPLLAVRFRRLAKTGLSIHRLSVSSDDWLMPLSTDLAIAPAHWPAFLAMLLITVCRVSHQSVPTGVDLYITETAQQRYTDQVTVLSEKLLTARSAAIFLGSFADQHPDASILHALSYQLSQALKGRFGFLGTGANYLSASALSLFPAVHPLDRPIDLLCLFHTEPHYDCSLTTEQKLNWDRAGFVVNFSCYIDPEDHRSDLLLPLAAFLETEGTFINLAGCVQTVRPTVRPVGDIKPGWKILKVLLERLGDDRATAYATCAAVRESIPFLSDVTTRLGDNAYHSSGTLPAAALLSKRESKDHFHPVSYLPVYMADSIVRRAQALQKTALSTTCEATVSSQSADRLGLKTGDRLRISQDTTVLDLPVRVNASLAEDLVLLPVHHLTAALFNRDSCVHLERI